MLLTLPRLLPHFTTNTSCQCTKTFLSVSYMVRDSDKRLAAATHGQTLRYRRLYRTLRYLGPHPPVSFIFAFEGRAGHADSSMAFRSKPGFTSSRPRMFMFGITTFMFVLGIIMLVLETATVIQQMQSFLYPTAGNVWSPYRTKAIIVVGGTFTRLLVRLYDAPISSAPLNW